MKSFIIVSLTSLLIGVIALGSGAYNMAERKNTGSLQKKSLNGYVIVR